MVSINISQDTELPPERVLAALTDFSGARLTLFARLDEKYFEVHQLADTHAEVTEGSAVAGGIWERTRYDWSEPGVVQSTVIESNAFAKGSTWRYVVTARPGGSHVQLTVERVPKTWKARGIALAMALAGPRLFAADLARTLRAAARS